MEASVTHAFGVGTPLAARSQDGAEESGTEPLRKPTRKSTGRERPGMQTPEAQDMTPTGIVPSGRVGVKLFTLVEVVIAIGLMSVGLLSIIGLLPVSLQATRDSVAESYAGDNAEEFLHYLSLRLKMPGNDYANWDQYGKVLPTSKPSETGSTPRLSVVFMTSDCGKQERSQRIS